MGCGCQERKAARTIAASAEPTTYVVTFSDGTVSEFDDYQEAAMASATRGGILSRK